MFTKAFWAAASERALWTFAQAVGGFYIAGVVVFDLNDLQTTWKNFLAALSVGVSAAALSLVKSIIVAKSTDGSPGLAEVTKQQAADEVNAALVEENDRQARLATKEKNNGG
jgi:hypothetical protein